MINLSRDMLNDVSRWPKFSNVDKRYLCLIRLEPHEYTYGMLIDDGLTVYLGNVFSGLTGESLTYETVDDLLADGWIVD